MSIQGRDERLAEIFGAAADLGPEERARLLAERCGDDPTLRAEIESLLDCDRAAPGTFLRSGAGAASADERSGFIGRYRLLRELGRGGQGTVHLAEDPTLGRHVALKVLDGIGPGSSGLVQRFEREARLASALEHPAICAVYEAGVDRGIPFIAMQYVEGETLAARISRAKAGEGRAPGAATGTAPSGASARNGEPRSDRSARAGVLRVAALIEQAARALHAAHEAGIVHRDVKPGNIMITTEETPVVLDFGLARQEGTDQPALTRPGDLFGTPSYMPPEQLRRADARLDRRADVWSLGVTLYEALTLRKPFEGPTTEALYLAIQTREPSDPRRANPAVPHDLAIVVTTALEKDRDRRYQTALAFAEDLRRVREREPILARPAGPIVRARRWAERHPGVAAALALAFLSLAGGLATTWVQKERARSAELLAVQRGELAEKRLRRAEEATKAAETALANHAAITKFLTGTLALANPEITPTREFSVRSLLDRTSREAGRALEGQPAAEAMIRTTVGRAWLVLGEPDQAEVELQRALELKEALGASPTDVDETLRPLVASVVDRVTHRFATLGFRLMENTPRIFADSHPELAAALARATGAYHRRKFEDLLPACAAIESAAASALSPDDARWGIVAGHLFDVGYCVDWMQRPELAEPYLRAALRIDQSRLRPGHPIIADRLHMLAHCLSESGRAGEAVEVMRASLALAERAYSSEHPSILAIRISIARFLPACGDSAESGRILRETIPICRRILGESSPRFLRDTAFAVRHFSDSGDSESSERLREELPELIAHARILASFETIATAFGKDQREIVEDLRRLDALVPTGGATPERVPRLRRELNAVLDDLQPRLRELPPSSPPAVIAARILAGCGDGWNAWLDTATHLRLVEIALPILEIAPPGLDGGIEKALFEAARNAIRRKEPALAERHLRRALEFFSRAADPPAWRVGSAKATLGAAIADQGRLAEAESPLFDGLRMLRESLGDQNPNTRIALDHATDLLCRSGRPAEALVPALQRLRQGWSFPVGRLLELLRTRSERLTDRLRELADAPADGRRDRELVPGVLKARVEAADPGDPAMLCYAEAVHQIGRKRAEMRLDLGCWQELLEDAREVLNRHLAPPRRRVASIDELIAYAAVDSGHIARAEDVARELVRQIVEEGRGRGYGDADFVPTESVGRVLLARVLSAGGRSDEAEREVGRAWEIHRTAGDAFSYDARCALSFLTRLLGRRRADEALGALWEPLLAGALGLSEPVPKHDDLVCELAVSPGVPAALLRRGLAVARSCAAAFGDGGSTYDLTVALFLTRLGEIPEALDILERVYEKNVPQRDLVLALRALGHASKRDAAAARESMRRARAEVRSSFATADLLAEAESLLASPPPER